VEKRIILANLLHKAHKTVDFYIKKL